MDFIAFDFETGNYSKDSAISIGLVKYTGGKVSDSFYSLIRPPRLYIRPDFTEIHGLTVSDVKDAPTFEEIWDRILDFIGDSPLVAHNASFDAGVLRSVLCHYGIPLPESIDFFDSLQIARRVWKEFPCHRLTFLGEQFGIVYEAHNALADSETCGKVILEAAKKLGLNAEKCSVKQLLEKSGCEMRRL